jgi:hypothetical protein
MIVTALATAPGGSDAFATTTFEYFVSIQYLSIPAPGSYRSSTYTVNR